MLPTCIIASLYDGHSCLSEATIQCNFWTFGIAVDAERDVTYAAADEIATGTGTEQQQPQQLVAEEHVQDSIDDG